MSNRSKAIKKKESVVHHHPAKLSETNRRSIRKSKEEAIEFIRKQSSSSSSQPRRKSRTSEHKKSTADEPCGRVAGQSGCCQARYENGKPCRNKAVRKFHLFGFPVELKLCRKHLRADIAVKIFNGINDVVEGLILSWEQYCIIHGLDMIECAKAMESSNRKMVETATDYLKEYGPKAKQEAIGIVNKFMVLTKEKSKQIGNQIYEWMQDFVESTG